MSDSHLSRDERRRLRAEQHQAEPPMTEADRIRELRDLAREFHYVEGVREVCDRGIAEGTIPGVVRAEVCDMVRDHAARAPKVKPRTFFDSPIVTSSRAYTATRSWGSAASPIIGMSNRDLESYSLTRGIAALLAARDASPVERCLELEASDAVARELGRQPTGFYVPGDLTWPIVHRHFDATRAAPMGVGTAGTQAAALVGTQHMAGAFIEALRPATIVMELGATTLPGLTSNVEIPKATGRATTHWIGEDAAPDESEVPIGSVNMTPRTVACDVPITRRMILQSTPAVEAIVRADIVRSVAEAIDLAALNGSGAAAEPLGVLNHPDIGTVAVSTDGAPTWLEVLEFEETLALANALTPACAFVLGPTAQKHMKAEARESGAPGFVLERGRANGYRAVVSNHLGAADMILFGDFRQILIGQWGVMDVMVDIYSEAARRRTVLRVTQDLDIQVRHGAAFAKQT